MSELHRHRPPRNYLARGEQLRLLGLVMGLGLVVILMSQARNPKNYRWLTELGGNGGNAGPETTDIDNLYQPTSRGSEIPDAFIARAEPRKAEADSTGRYFPGVKPGHLEKVRDNAPFGSADSEENLAWLNLLEIVRTTEQETLEKASTGRATYAQLSKQSADYRGKLVTVQGTARRANRAGAPKNDLGIEKYRRVWIFPDDNPSSPLVAYVLTLPEGFPMGMEIEAGVELTGFFFKRWSYLSGDPATGEQQLRVAPVLLARTLIWRKSEPSVPPPATDPFTLGTIFGVALLAAVVVVVMVLRRSGGRPASTEDLPETIQPAWDAGPSEAGLPPEAPPDRDWPREPE